MTRGRRITLGFLIMGIAFGITLWWSGSWGIALCITCVALVVLPPSIDPAIQIKERQQQPTCFGSRPGPQQRAENDCDYCPWNKECLR